MIFGNQQKSASGSPLVVRQSTLAEIDWRTNSQIYTDGLSPPVRVRGYKGGDWRADNWRMVLKVR